MLINDMSKKIKSFFVTILFGYLFLNISVASALTIENKTGNDKTDVYLTLPKTLANQAEPGSCKKDEGGRLWYAKNWRTGKDFILTAGNRDYVRYICIVGVDVSQKLYLNPVADVPTCHIQLIGIQGHGLGVDGYARATPDCKYTGNCTDLKPYSADREECCPSERWDNNAGTCSK